jgi:predicted alpha/beta hydrolase
MQTAQSQASVQVPVQAAVQWTEMALPISVGSAHLALRQCQPRAAAPLAQVVVAGAMGVQQSYYQAFARWLAEQGYGVTTFDYRGHGLSLQVPLRDARADLLDWAKDCELVAAQLKQQFLSSR